jgi:MFS family permease
MDSSQAIRSTGAFRLATFLRAIAEGFIAVSVPFQAIKLGAGPLQLGILGTLMSASYSGGCLVFSRFIGRIPRRSSVLSVLVFLSLIGLALGYAPTLPVLYALVVVAALGAALFWPQVMAWLADQAESEDLTRQFGSFNLAWCSGFPVGMVIGGNLFEIRMLLPYYGIFAVTLTAAAVLWLFTGPARNRIRSERSERRDEDRDIPTGDISEPPVGATRARTFILMSWIAMFATYFVCGNFRYQLPKLTTSVGMGEGTFGALMFLLYGSQVLAFFILMRSERWHFKRRFLWPAQILVALGSVLIYFSVKPLALAAAFLMAGAGMGITYFSSQYYGLRYAAGRGQRAAIHEALIGAGYLSGAFFGGQLAELYSLRAPYIGSVLVLLLLLLAQIVLEKRRHPREEEPLRT